MDRNPTGDRACDYIKKSFELKNNKLYKEAVEMLYKALGCEDIGERNTEVVSQIGDLYFLLKNYERAIEQYEKALETDKCHAHSLYRLCEIHFLQNHYEKALGLIKELCESSKTLKNYIHYFKILLKMNLCEQATELYRTLEDEEIKNNDEVLYLLSKVDPKNKREFLEKTIASNPLHTRAHFDLGVILFEEGNLQKARESFKAIIEAGRMCAPAYYHMGLAEQKLGNFTKAIEYLLAATKINPQVSEYFFDLAKSYTDIAWYDEAQIAAFESLKLLRVQKPLGNFDEHHFLLAWTYIQKKDFKSALLNLGFIPENSPFVNEAKVLEALVDFETGDFARAKTTLEKCRKKIGQNAILLSTLGKVYKELRLYDSAAELYEGALVLFPASLEYASELIDILIDKKEYDKALRYASVFKEQNPKNPGVHNSVARVYYRQGKLKEALLELEKLVELDPNDPEGRYFAGLVLNDLAKADKALESLVVALELDPSQPKYYAQLARAHYILRDFKGALLFVKEAIGLAPETLSYFELALSISKEMNDKNSADFFLTQIKRLEKIIKQTRETTF